MACQCEHIYWPKWKDRSRLDKTRVKPLGIYLVWFLLLPVLWVFWLATGGDLG
jgi:hypothetical protein